MAAKGLLRYILLTALLFSSNAGLVKKILRHRRQTLGTPKELNLTLPNAEHPVVFNHVYNVNVPVSSLCTVKLDTSDGAELQPKDATVSTDHHSTEHTLDGENQIVFTHRINIPRQACGCEDSLPGLKDLISRIEMLEGEVSTLRTQCNGACCGTQVTGGTVTKPFCNGHGNYSAEICGCRCETGWKGPNCTEPECPGDCQGRGHCHDGKCECFKGFSGEDCALEVCSVDCGAHGECVGGVCICLDGFFGERCSQSKCPNNCNGRGHCKDKRCVCDEPWTGSDCSEVMCPKACNDRGRCANGTCQCNQGYTGKDCGERICPNNCHGNGFCVDGECICTAGYSGEDCSQLTCLKDCNGRGTCFNGMCTCDPGYQGEDCSQLACLNNCNNRGQCINGRCACDVSFQGDDCSELSCPRNCQNRGRCVNGQCVCEEDFAGEDCSVRTCPSSCYGRGECVDGRCECHVGFTGTDCGELSCPNSCQYRGRCVDGQCVCDEGFAGDDCGQTACPNDCHTRGKCTDGKCVCQEGYSGEDCSVLSCPENCNNRGRCIKGRCTCESGYEGESCSQLSCLNSCHDKGQCVNGQCVCDEGYIGKDCSEVSPPKDLSVGGVTADTVELTWSNEMLVTEYLVAYEPTREGGLRQEFVVPGDKTSATIKGLEPGLEYQINVYAVLSNKRSIPVSARVATALPAPGGLRFTSVRETSVEVTWDHLDIPFDGWEIYFRHTKEENGKVVSILPSSQNQFVQSGLGPGQEYEVSINIIKNNTRGPTMAKKVTTRIAGPRHLAVKDVTDSSALVSWSQPEAPADEVTVAYGPSDDPSDVTSVEIAPADKQHSISGLRPDTEYRVTLVSRRGDVSSDPVNTTFTTALDAPKDLISVSQSFESITLEWKNSRADAGSYRVKYSPISGAAHGDEVFPRQPGDITTATITGLKPGTEYGIGVTAIQKERESLPTTINAATDLDPPRDLVQTSSSESSIALRWRKPRAKVTGYRLAYVSRDGAVEEVALPATATAFVLPDLNPGTSYTISLMAERGHRRSTPASLLATTAVKPTPSDVLTLTLKDTPPTSGSAAVQTPDPLRPPPPTDTAAMSSEPTESSVPDILGNLTVTNVTSASVSLAWSAPDGAFDSFLVELSTPSEPEQAHVNTLPGGARAADVEGLSQATAYNITLRGLAKGNRSLLLEGFVTTEELRPTALNLSISDITWEGFTASWSPEGGEFDSYVIEVTNVDNLAESQNLTLSGGALSLAIMGLNPNTSYVVGLYGMYQGSFFEPVYTGATTVNQPVVGKLYVSKLTSESFTLNWNDTEGAFDGFILEIIDSDWLMEPREFNISHNVTSHDIMGLRPNTDYVAYLYGMYKGSRTNAVSIVASTAEEPDLSRLVVSNVTSDRVSLSWQTGEKAFDNFIVEVRESALPSQAMGRALPGDVRSTVMAGLRASTGYDIKLYASIGGQNTQPLFAVATTEDIPQLGPIDASSVSPHNLSVSWSTVSGHFDGFVIRVSDSERQSDPMEFRLPGEASNFTVSNLVDATGYDIELYGISHGRHTPSVLAHATTAPLPKVENLTISNVTPYGFRVSWEVQHQEQQQEQQLASSSGGFRRFHIVVTDSGWLLEPQEFNVPGNRSHLDIWGLITGIGYEVRLTGVSESGLLSRPLTTVAVTEAEPEVEHLFVSDSTADSFRVSWTADEDMFDRFVIKIRDSKRLAHPQEYSVHGNERTKLLTGLLSGTEYEIELYGISLDQRSQPITGVAQTALTTPRGLHFSEVTESSAIVHWTMLGAPVDNYRVTYVPFEGGSPLTVTVDGDVMEALLPNMSPGKLYQVTVSAVKGLEESDPSTDTVTTALDTPTGLTAINVTDNSALLLWQPSVATVDGYVIVYTADALHQMTEHVSGNTVEFAMSSLLPGTPYTVRVHAVKEDQKSTFAYTEFTTDVDPPRELRAVNIQTDSAMLTWKPPQAAVTGYTLAFSSADGSVREVVLSPTATSYNMAQLSGSTEYNVHLQANAGAKRSRRITTLFTTIGQIHKYHKDCAQLFLSGVTTSGIYTVFVNGEESQSIQVYCDMTTDGGGWLVFLRRQNGKLEFFRNWKNYTAGFGNMNDEFWLGLSKLHKITSTDQYELRVDLRDKGESAYAQYSKFTIAEPKTRYKLYIGSYSGTAGDSLAYHEGRPFSTYDSDNDIAVTNCALSYKGAFWYKNCHRVNLMGKYGDRSHSKGVNWFHWKGHETSIEFAEMKIRPANFRNFESRKKRS